MYKNRLIAICKIRENFFLVNRLVTLIVYDYSFDHTSKIFYIILIVIISVIIHPKFIYIICFCFQKKKKKKGGFRTKNVPNCGKSP